MSIKLEDLKLIPWNDELLARKPKLFDFQEHDAQHVCDTLFEKQRQLGGVGLSANQVGLDMKIFVFGDGKELKRYIINPEIIHVSDEMVTSREGCLSMPGLWLDVKRPVECTASYQTVDGDNVTETFKELASVVFLHEYDHMLGQNFTQRVSKFKLDRAVKKLKKDAKKKGIVE